MGKVNLKVNRLAVVAQPIARFVRWLYDYDPEFVEDGCADVANVVVSYANSIGIPSEVEYGYARTTEAGLFPHAWVNIDGVRWDPTIWAISGPSTFGYKIDRDVMDLLLSETESDGAYYDYLIGRYIAEAH